MMTTESEPPTTAALKAEAIQLAAALHTVASEANEGEIVRIAFAALMGTTTGRDYVSANPIRY